MLMCAYVVAGAYVLSMATCEVCLVSELCLRDIVYILGVECAYGRSVSICGVVYASM